jgi:hypothetical protein
MIRIRAVCMLLALAACATTGASGQGDQNLPTTDAGPFRKLDGTEVAGVAPFVLDDRTLLFREPAVLADGNVPGGVILYAVARQGGRDVIVRSRADDARSFYGTASDIGHTPPTVLAPEAAWEGDALSGPFVLPTETGLLLYYAAKEGIGVARSTDGFTFTREQDPILSRDLAVPWETTELRGPTAYVGQDHRIHVFYASGAAIGEAVSDDGVRFTRVGSDPVLVPSRAPAPEELLPNEKPPFDTVRVGDPSASTRITPGGRFQVRVFYTGEGAGGATAIGFAGRYGDSGPLARNVLPVYSVNQKEVAPAYLEAPDHAYLYVQQERRADSTTIYPAIAAAFSPGNVHLDTPAPFPAGP